jgi:ketosteroid isomerase-like protein
MEKFNMEEILRISEIEISGQWAFARGEYTFLASPKAGVGSFQDKGKFINILKRMPNGLWKCTHSIWNSDSPPLGK